MSLLYNAIIALVVMSCITLVFLVYENNRFSAVIKDTFSKCCIFLAVAALSEWSALALNGAPAWTIWIHKFFKACDYVFSPFFAFYLVKHLCNGHKNKHLIKVTHVIEAVNTCFVVLSIFTGWAFYIDEGNFYHHGPLYWFYVVCYFGVYLMTLMSFVIYTRNFKRKNLFSLFLIFLIIMIAIIIQEFVDPNCRITYLAITLAMILMYIHYSEFYQLKNDDIMVQQEHLIRTDPLTLMLNRYAYNEIIAKYSNKSLPPNMVIFSIDINALKYFNDNYGHVAGDELIVASSQIIQEVLSYYGSCYKTGGDEFVCILEMDKDTIAEVKAEITRRSQEWKGEYPSVLSLAVGYARACEHPECNLEKLIIFSDKMMYNKKALFHSENPEYRR